MQLLNNEIKKGRELNKFKGGGFLFRVKYLYVIRMTSSKFYVIRKKDTNLSKFYKIKSKNIQTVLWEVNRITYSNSQVIFVY